MKKIIESNENENTMHKDLWNIAKVVLHGRLMPVNACIKKSERDWCHFRNPA
jgi:hypothetical protein